MNDPIDVLLEEHRQFMIPIRNLRLAVESLSTRGDSALAEVRSVLGEVALMMTTHLLVHARKEDEALFPALERSFDRNHGPTAVLRAEHVEVEAQARLFERTVRQLEHVEHPAIVAGGSALAELAAQGAEVTRMIAVARELLDLLDSHFGKEEAILFPMARQILNADELADVARRMEAVEAG